jgi:hypothetical protein
MLNCHVSPFFFTIRNTCLTPTDTWTEVPTPSHMSPSDIRDSPEFPKGWQVWGAHWDPWHRDQYNDESAKMWEREDEGRTTHEQLLSNSSTSPIKRSLVSVSKWGNQSWATMFSVPRQSNGSSWDWPGDSQSIPKSGLRRDQILTVRSKRKMRHAILKPSARLASTALVSILKF